MLSRIWIAGAVCAGAALAANTAGSKVTFHKDVAPIFQKKCQSCHRPGEIGPMSLLTYKDARPWAKAIKQAVATKKMPPWFADPNHGKFANDPSLTEAELTAIANWADQGAPEGNAKDAPKPMEWVTGWGIGKPDVIYTVPKYDVPAQGVVDYKYVVIPTNFKEDTWIQMAEARPGNRSATHHIVVYVREPGSYYMSDAKPGEFFQPPKREQRRPASKEEMEEMRKEMARRLPTEIIVGYAPGTDPVALPPGTAKLIKAGSDLVVQMHYTPNGKAGEDVSQIGFKFAKGPVKERVYIMSAPNLGFAIPPGDANHEVKSSVTVHRDVKLVDFNPHMHLRGKDFQYTITYPDGRQEVALKVKYDFDWQLYYRPKEPIFLPAGTRIDCVAHFDNSANNPKNPDPKATVRFGEQSWEEMMIGWFDIAMPADLDPRDLMRPAAAKKSTGEE